MNKLVLVKFGGSLITYKDRPYAVRRNIISKLAKEIKEAQKKHRRFQIVVGNGNGSYGHYPAILYNVLHGAKTKKQKRGFAFVQQKVKELNLSVVEALLEQKVNAVSIHPSSILTASKGQPNKVFLDSFEGFINFSFMPVIYGDIVYDDKLGSKVFSTEALFQILIEKLHRKKFIIDKVIYLSIVNGVVDLNGKLVKHVTKENFPAVKKHLYQTEGYDVTGGMMHKVEQSLIFAERGISTYIVNGSKDNILEQIFQGKNPGTMIS